jgi:pimeloyl-ACP methyl ester carboxylesterase
MTMTHLEMADRSDVFVPHAFEEHQVDLGEIRLNYASTGDQDLPPLLLVPGQSASWWSYERALPLLSARFRCFAVDLRGQGRSTWTPGRYTVDNFGNDLVRFIDLVIGRPTVVSGHSSGGVISAWLSAYAKPGQIVASVWEDAPIFASELNPATGQSIRQGVGPLFALWNKWLGDQWTIGDVGGLMKAMRFDGPAWLPVALQHMFPPVKGDAPPAGVPQNLREYDPEWGRAFVSGFATASSDHATLLEHVKVPVLLTHHFRQLEETTGTIIGALSDLQARRAQQLVEAAGQPFTYRSFPTMPHSMHEHDPELFAATITEWHSKLGS